MFYFIKILFYFFIISSNIYYWGLDDNYWGAYQIIK